MAATCQHQSDVLCPALAGAAGSRVAPPVVGLLFWQSCRLFGRLLGTGITPLHLLLLGTILRHSQFEDLATAGFADPIDTVLRSVEPDASTHARIEITVRPTRGWRDYWAKRAVDRLNHAYFRAHEARSVLYARSIMHPLLWPLAGLLALPAGKRHDRPYTAPVDLSAGRHHEREDDVQAASDKVGGHLFDTHVRLVAYAPEGHRRLA